MVKRLLDEILGHGFEPRVPLKSGTRGKTPKERVGGGRGRERRRGGERCSFLPYNSGIPDLKGY